MKNLNEEVLQAINKLGMRAQQLNDIYFNEIFFKTCKIYVGGNYDYPLWEKITDWAAVTHEDGWIWIKEYLIHKECILFFEKFDNESAISFNSGEDIVAVLSECFGFVFYVTDKKSSFLISFNDHNNLICSGDAKEWLCKYKLIKENSYEIYRSK